MRRIDRLRTVNTDWRRCVNCPICQKSRSISSFDARRGSHSFRWNVFDKFEFQQIQIEGFECLEFMNRFRWISVPTWSKYFSNRAEICIFNDENEWRIKTKWIRKIKYSFQSTITMQVCSTYDEAIDELFIMQETYPPDPSTTPAQSPAIPLFSTCMDSSLTSRRCCSTTSLHLHVKLKQLDAGCFFKERDENRLASKILDKTRARCHWFCHELRIPWIERVLNS